MIVPPDEKQQQSKECTGNQGEESQGSRRHRRCVRRDGIYVKNQPTDTDKQKNGPSDDPEIRPLNRRAELLRKGRSMLTMRGRSAHNQVGSATTHHDSTQPRSAFTSEEPFLVS